MLAQQVILSVSIDLNDQEPGNEYIHWSYEQLRQYLLEAMQQLSQVAHKLFIKRKIMRVESGATWHKACCDCDQIIRVIGETDADGNLLHTLRRIQDNPDNEWPVSIPDMCPVTDETYEMEGYSISNIDDSYFQVVPAVPEGSVRYIMLECFVGVHAMPDNYDIHWRLVTACRMWMIGRAYMIDSENNQAVFELGQKYIMLYDKQLEQLKANLNTEEEEKHIGNAVGVGTSPKGQS